MIHAQVLIVDDEPDHAETMGEALRRLGHVCTSVHSGAEAIEEIRYGVFDVIVTDLVMESEDSGLQVLAAAREHQPDAETIMVTAHGDITTAKAAPARWGVGLHREALGSGSLPKSRHASRGNRSAA